VTSLIWKDEHRENILCFIPFYFFTLILFITDIGDLSLWLSSLTLALQIQSSLMFL